MIEIKFHGRGGQGAVTAAELLAKAAFEDGKYCQAFPFFGVERRGAPVMAFARIDDKFITPRQYVYDADYVVVLDPTLLSAVDVMHGLKEGGKVIVNSHKSAKALGLKGDVRVVDATKIALEVIGKPIVNTVMLGAFAKASHLVSLQAVQKVVQARFPGKVGESNAEAVKRAYEGLQ